MSHARFLLSLLILSLAGCETELPEQIGKVNCQITSDMNSAFASRLVFDRGYVHLSRVEVNGLKNDTRQVAFTDFEQPEQFFFIGDDPRQPIRVPIAEATYDDPKVTLFFYRDPYVLQVSDTVYEDSPEGGNAAPDPVPGNNDGGGNDQGDDDGDDDRDDSGEGDSEEDGDDNSQPGNDEDNDQNDSDNDNEGDGTDENNDEGEGDEGDDDGDENGDDGDDDNAGDEDEDDESDDGDDDDGGEDDEGDDGDDDGGEDDGDDNDDDGRVKSTRGKTVNLSDFIANAKPSVLLLGSFLKGDTLIQVIVAVDLDQIQLAPATRDPMTVQSSDKIFATATVYPGRWFESLPESDLNKCYLINFRSQTVLFIHKDFNSTIYQSIQGKIQESTQLEFRVESNL